MHPRNSDKERRIIQLGASANSGDARVPSGEDSRSQRWGAAKLQRFSGLVDLTVVVATTIAMMFHGAPTWACMLAVLIGSRISSFSNARSLAAVQSSVRALSAELRERDGGASQ